MQKKFILLLLIVLFSPFSFGTARADVGPQPILPGGSSLQPGAATPIRMLSEVVTMNVRQATVEDNALVKMNPKSYALEFAVPWFPGMAEVEAEFLMKNPTAEDVTMTVWFPLASALENAGWSSDLGSVPSIVDFQASVEGQPVTHQVSQLPNPQGKDRPDLPWASFEVTFPAGKETNLQVQYTVPLQPAVKDSLMALYYIFQTGAGWDGPIGRAELIVNLPYPASAETMTGKDRLALPPLYQPKTMGNLPEEAELKGNQARWVWQDFEPAPEDDFAVWLIRPQKWQEMEKARAAVKVNPRDGQAWLDLATVYHSLSLTGSNQRRLFSPVYLQPAVDAYRKVAELLPDHPVPQAALGLFALQPYLAEQNAPPTVLEYVQGQLILARQLEAKDDTLTHGRLVDSNSLANALSDYNYNEATASVAAQTAVVMQATETARATIEYATRTVWAYEKGLVLAWRATELACWDLYGKDCTPTFSPIATTIPSQAPPPSVTMSPLIERKSNPTLTVRSSAQAPAADTPERSDEASQDEGTANQVRSGSTPWLILFPLLALTGLVLVLIYNYRRKSG